jgi:hypothetical protein
VSCTDKILMYTTRLHRLFDRSCPGARRFDESNRRRRSLYRLVLLLPLWCGLLYPTALVWPAETGASDIEYQIKAAYLYKFASHVEWPPGAFPEAGTPVTIGVIGADEVAVELNRLKGGRSVNSRSVEVKLLKSGEPTSGMQMLFIGHQENSRLKRLLDTIQSQPMLTVTDSVGALAAGSVINFVPVDSRIRFEVSVAQAERSGLKISARLLAVAQRIEGRP